MKRTLLLACITLTLISANAQFSWPPITQTTKPWTRWWWEGSAVTKPDLTAAMQLYAQAGLGGLEITPIYGVKGYEDTFIDFLSPQWVEMLQYTLSEGKRLQLGIDMANATGWPFGGPWVTPDDASKYVAYTTYTLNGGEQLKDTIQYIQEALVRTANGKSVSINQLTDPVNTNKQLQDLALDQVRFRKPLPLVLLMAYPQNGAALDLTHKVDKNGRLNWTAPAGKWNLYALFEGWHGKMVERAAPGGEGPAIDHFSALAIKHYLAAFDKAFEGKDVSGIRSFFNDSYEVDDARGQANWTPGFLQAFKQRRGYDISDYLPALFGKENTEKNNRIIYDYRLTISELLLDNFTKPWHDWASARGAKVRNQSHGSPANILDLYAAVDIPETEGNDILRYKFATSTAHVTGKPLVSSESATWLNEHFQSSLGDVKTAIDKYFIGGVNHVFYHGTAYSPQNDPWPGWLFYAAVHFQPVNPLWKDFGTLNNYIARCQSFLQSGKPDNDILLYFPFSDRIAEPGNTLLFHFDGMEGFERSTFKTAAQYLLDSGYTFDLISDRQLKGVTVAGHQLQSAGNSWQIILLADTRYLPLETMQKLVQSVKNGATLVFYKSVPASVPGYAKQAERQSAYNQLLAQLTLTSTGTVKKAPLGNGFVLSGDDLPELLAAAKTRPESLVQKGLRFVRRQYDHGNYYFISNPGTQPVEGWVALQSKTLSTMLFDPMFENSGLAQTRKTANGGTEVLLQLAPGGSCIVQTTGAWIKGAVYPYTKTNGTPQPITGTWQLSFISGGPQLPAATTLHQLGSWTDLPGNEPKAFSGTAQYSIQWKKPSSAKADAWLLDLGKCAESAELFLNGKRLATLVGPSFQYIIPASLLNADNELQVLVTNGMANRIADMDKRGIPWKKFYNTNMPARIRQNTGPDGLFTAANWAPKASGLSGPVTITPLIY